MMRKKPVMMNKIERLLSLRWQPLVMMDSANKSAVGRCITVLLLLLIHLMFPQFPLVLSSSIPS